MSDGGKKKKNPGRTNGKTNTAAAKVDAFLSEVGGRRVERFKRERRVLSFPQYLELFRSDPLRLSRNAAQYVFEAYEYYGTREVRGPCGGTETRFCLFDAPFDDGRNRLYGHEALQREIHRRLKRFALSGRTDRLLLLHGPNGSAKSTVVELIVRALEHYSTLDEGALFRFNWIFPVRAEGRERLGFGGDHETDPGRDGYAFLDEREIACKLCCELRESPLFLLPEEERAEFLESILADSPADEAPARRRRCEQLCRGALSAKSRAVFDALMTAYQGDWRRVVRHIQVERWFVSRRYRRGAVTIEPQQAVDAGVIPISFDQGATLPPALHGLRLVELAGELADASGGLVEYSDFLKRPLELNKYLLNTCERGTVSVAGVTAELNEVMFGTCNEKQLSAFKMIPDFPSYKGRIELLRTPYLLEWEKERELYETYLKESGDLRHIAPHTAGIAALWAVLTRLRRPDPGHYPDEAAEAVTSLSPLEKARFYSDGSLPDRFTSEQRRELKAAAEKMWREFNEESAVFEDFACAAYEGRRGASAREIKALLAEAAAESRFVCLSPPAVFRALDRLRRDRGVYEFLRLEPEGEYRDQEALSAAVRGEYLRLVTTEVYDSLELVESGEYERRVSEYFRHVRAYVSGEKIRRETDGKLLPPSEEVMAGLEKHLQLKEPPDKFRRNLVSRIAAYSLEHPDEKLDYAVVCAALFRDLKRNYYTEKRRQLEQLARPIPLLGTDDEKTLSAAAKKDAARALRTMKERHGYCDHCATEAVLFVLRADPPAEAAPR